MNKILKRIINRIIPFKKLQTSLYENQLYHEKVIKRLKKKVSKGKKIRVGFLVIFDSVFPGRQVFEKMLKDDMFEPFIVVIPNKVLSEKKMFELMNKTYTTLYSEYGDSVISSYNREFVDIKNKIDIAFFSNPYNKHTVKYYRISYLSKYNILTCYIPYGPTVSNWYEFMDNDINLPYLWKYFVENNYSYEKLLYKSFIPENVLTLIGYSKMDGLNDLISYKRDRKKIIIAPHHTIIGDVMNFSTFLQYSDFFLELPKHYPDIDFVFRPHPVLRENLEKDDVWGYEKTEKYFNDISAISNVEYQNGGNYLETFVNSDGMIHDCGSFMTEYMYTKNPPCFLLKDEERNNKNFNPFAKECILRHYKAFSEKDILDYIDTVIIKGNDYMKEERKTFFEQNLKFNYPNTTQKILDNMKEEILQ